MKDNTKKPVVVLIHNQEVNATEEVPLDDIKKEIKETKKIPVGIFTGAALIEMIMAATSQ